MKDSIRILFVEDVQTDAEMIWTEISRNNIKFEKKLVDNKADYIDALTSFDPQMIISDYSLPQFDGLSALFIKNQKNLSIPFILVTGSINEEVAVDMMKAGVDDYVIKQNLSRLGPAILGSLKKQEILCEKEAAENALRESEEKFRMLFNKAVESEERYRLLIENQGEGVGIVNLEENFVFVNPAAEEMFGVEKGGLLNRNLMDFVKPEHKAIIERETKKRINSEKSSYEIDIIRPNRELRTLIITATPQFTNDGILSGTFGVFRDITERKQMEQKIIESEVYYRTLVDISPDGILITNLEGNVLYGSKKAYEIFGIPPGEDVTGTSIFRWLAPDSQEAIMERVMRIMKGNVAPETREFKLKKFDGSAFWGEISSSPLADKEGNPLSLIIVCRDISDRKKYEYEIIKSKEKAEESDRLKTAFLHNISHEIRTPMNAIIGFSALLSEPDLDEESQKSFIEIIIQSSNHLLTIVSDIIEISNIEAGILKLNIKNTNLNYIFKTLHNQFFPKASEKNNDFQIDTVFKDGEAQVWTDQTKLIQILSILLSNALKFTSGGKITMGYRIKENFIEFVVSDTGIGIPKEHFNKIFERFYQVENTIARQYEGTGLGLSIAKAYVELLGGEIWLTSEPGSGTTVLFTIPYSSANPTLKEEKKTVVIEAK